MTETSIDQKVQIGEYLDGGQIYWDWNNAYDARLFLAGSEDVSNKEEWLETIINDVTKDKTHFVFRISHQLKDKVDELEKAPLLNILEFEKIPTPQNTFDGKEMFIDNRRFFVSFYINLLALKKGMKRKDYLPLSIYNPSAEGPLQGYVRTIKELTNTERKEEILSEFHSLEEVSWYKKSDNHFIYTWDSNGSIEEDMLSFLKGCWSFWAFTEVLKEPCNILLIIDNLPSRKVESQLIENSYIRLLKILNDSTLFKPITMILNSHTIYPVEQLNFRYRVFMKGLYPDFDLTVQENQDFITERILNDWKMNKKSAAYLLHDISNNVRYQLKTK